MHTRSHQAAYVRHVHEHVGADLVAYLADALPVYDAGVRRGAGYYHLRPEFLGLGEQGVIVDELRLPVHAVGAHVEVLAGYGRLGAVRQMAAAAEVHAHEHVAGLGQGQVHGHVGLGAGMRLHIGVLRAEELAGALAGNLLHDVHVLAAAVIALAGVALGVFVGEMAADSLHDGRGGKVLAGYELYMVTLAGELLLHHGIYFLVLAAKVFKVHCVSPQVCYFSLSGALPV